VRNLCRLLSLIPHIGDEIRLPKEHSPKIILKKNGIPIGSATFGKKFLKKEKIL